MINLQVIPTISGIYKFTNKLKNKVYIGQGINLRVRIKNHIDNYKKDKKNSHFYSSMKKYGIENFDVEILQQGNFSKTELDEMEITYIRLFKSQNPKLGYNMTGGGEGIVGFKHSEETKQKQRYIKLGKIVSQETREKLRSTITGKKHSKQSKEKISKVHKGKVVSQETRDKISKSGKGKIILQESIDKIKETKLKNGTWGKSVKLTQETLDKIRETKIKNGTLGITPSEETKKKISEKLKGRVSPRKGIPASNKGIRPSQESINKMVQTKIKNGTTRKGIPTWNKGKKFSPEEKDIIVKKIKQTKEFNKNMKLIQENNFIYDWLF